MENESMVFKMLWDNTYYDVKKYGEYQLENVDMVINQTSKGRVNK